MGKKYVKCLILDRINDSNLAKILVPLSQKDQ